MFASLFLDEVLGLSAKRDPFREPRLTAMGFESVRMASDENLRAKDILEQIKRFRRE